MGASNGQASGGLLEHFQNWKLLIRRLMGNLHRISRERNPKLSGLESIP
jgi:hypothetical protein